MKTIVISEELAEQLKASCEPLPSPLVGSRIMTSKLLEGGEFIDWDAPNVQMEKTIGLQQSLQQQRAESFEEYRTRVLEKLRDAAMHLEPPKNNDA